MELCPYESLHYITAAPASTDSQYSETRRALKSGSFSAAGFGVNAARRFVTISLQMVKPAAALQMVSATCGRGSVKPRSRENLRQRLVPNPRSHKMT
ncbi:hypothetical protein GDO78_017387 [Eleutherodactylus coqui]|uniref:Uncharacterized protein n=1 Tax=Eleutherodactylus coqui TaxID=57060 RepID=A0A8J6EBU3_ELECQ|nr:hypothetical protein GDO78_017387 [Eleutherodactylus coqui]